MRTALLLPLLAALAALAAAPSAQQTAEPPAVAQLYTAVQPETVTVGQPFRSMVRLTVAPGARAGYPPMPLRDEIQPIDSVRVLPSAAGATTATAVYTLVAWTTDPIEAVVPVRVTVPGGAARVYRVALRLPTVRSVLPAGAAEIAPRPARGVVAPPGRARPAWLWWAVAGAALAGLLAHLASRFRRARPAAMDDPRARALAGLEAIAVAESPAARRGVYVAVASVLREYLAALAGEWGMELTTTELLARLGSADVPAAPRQELAALLRAADRVKFAGEVPEPDAADRFRSAASHWVRHFPPPDEAGRKEAA